MVYKWLKYSLSGLSPSTCCLCQRTGDSHIIDLCSRCLSLFPTHTHKCVQCAAPIESDTQLICGSCLSSPPYFDAVTPAFPYDGPIKHLISQFKFAKRLTLTRVLSELLIEHGRQHASLPEAFIAMPLHPHRQRQRGFNQALELARPVSRQFRLPLAKQTLIRTRDTAAQTTLTARQRKANIRGAFAIAAKPAYRHIALIDDVLTTASTANEAAKVLKEAGVERVDIWSLARGQ